MFKLEPEMRNKLHNLSNPYQGGNKKVLTVCSAGLLRSPTMAVVLNREFGYNCRSCGVDDRYALVPFSHALHQWADEIVVAEQWMKNEIESMVRALAEEMSLDYEDIKVPINCLNIRDAYAYMDEKLQDLIVVKYNDLEAMSALQHRLAKELNIKD